MCTTPSGSEGGGEVPFCPQVARLQRGHPRLLLRVSPSETRAENNIPIYKFPETTIGITQCIFFGDENKTSIIHKSHSVSHGYYSVRLLRRHNVNSNKTTNQIDPYPKTIYVPIPYSLSTSLLTIYSNCSASNSVCIGKLNTSRANFSATGKSPALYLAS